MRDVRSIARTGAGVISLPEQPPPGWRWSNIVPLLLPDSPPSVLMQPPPPWPKQFETSWQPIPDGPRFTLAGTTKTISVTVGHFTVKDIREITFRVLGSKQRRANDWKDWRLCLRGRALHPDAIKHWHADGNMMAIGTGGKPLLIVIDVAVVGIRHTTATHVWGQSDFRAAENNFATVVPTGHTVTAKEKRLFDRGKDLLSTFVTTMTLRGKPGSGDSDEQRQAKARQRLFEAGRKLQQRRMKIGRRELTAPLMINSVDGVADVLSSAGWTLDDLKKELNSTHTS